MNKETLALIEKLSEKLGTTSEHLWGVLMKQAPIDAAFSFIFMVALLVGLWFLWKLAKKASDGMVYMAFVLVCVIVAIAVFSLSYNTLIGFFNPEYWALKEIMSSLKH